MGIQFFGEFLTGRWIVTRGQLLEALELQDYRNLKFGTLAVRNGYLTEEQVEQVNERQRQVDKPFGDLTVAMNLMTVQQVEEVLTFQKNNYLFLGDALLELGHVSDDVLERELLIYKEEQSCYSLAEVMVPDDCGQPDLIRVCVDLSRKMFTRVAGLLVRVGHGDRVDFLSEQETINPDYQLTVSTAFDGVASGRYFLRISNDVAVAGASRILKEDASQETEEMVCDACCEFCNIICGNAVAKLAQMGIATDIGPPESLPALPEVPSGQACVSFPVHLTEGAIDIRLFVPVA